MKVIIYDKNPGPGFAQWMLMVTWAVGSWVQKLLGVADKVYAATSWEDAQNWLKSLDAPHISSIQYWGHGSPGAVWLAQKTMRWDFFEPIKAKLGEDSVIWFRTCSTFQGQRGHDISRSLSSSLGCTIAGHTRIIGLLQGGLHTRRPLSIPSWPITEVEFKESWIPSWLKWGNNTVTCFATKIPKGW